MKTINPRIWIPTLLSAGLAACGGDSGFGIDGAGPPDGIEGTEATSPGIWSGTVAYSGGSGSVLVFAHGDDWRGVIDADDSLVQMFFDDLAGAPDGQATLTARRGSSLPGGGTADAGDLTTDADDNMQRAVTIRFDTAGDYELDLQYDSARTEGFDSSYPQVAGRYGGAVSDGTSLNLELDLNGAVTGTDSLGCTFSFTLQRSHPQRNIHRLDGDRDCSGSISAVSGSASWRSANLWTLLLVMSDGQVQGSLSRQAD